MAKILLVEDDQFIRDIYFEVLKSAKYTVTTAVDGKDALEKIRQGGWDIVLLDNVMPQLTGVEVLKEFKKEYLHTLAKYIILMTNTEETKELTEIGGLYDDYILKSAITPGDLIARVKQGLKK
jgi:DNA-binding response OmpR family regulator